MKRRSFLAAGAGLAAQVPANPQSNLPFSGEKSKLKIRGVRLVRTRAKRPVPSYQPAPGSWSTGGVEVANPMSIYPEYKATRSLFYPDPGGLGSFTVEIQTDKGVSGLGSGGMAGGPIVEGHLKKLLMGEDPFNVERIWDILWRSTMYYGRKGAVINAISGVDIAVWDIVGKALGMPVYKLLGGETKARIPCYCTGNDLEQHIEFGYKRLKLAMPHGPADGKEGQRKNVELVKRTRSLLGADGDIMLDCWMAWTERYTLEMAELLEPYKVYWMEECLQPHDYEGFGRLRQQIKSTRIVTGEHEYTRYGFRQLLAHNAAEIWQPDIKWCGGLTELRRIGALASAYDIPVIPHSGGQRDSVHWIMAATNSPWAEMFMPAPGGPAVVYERYQEDNNLTKGPEGIYTRPSEQPGFGFDFEAAGPA
ncbi:MAG: L-rhamnonate dehydratase [Acidimicrobiia bacterium]|nr:L-rhamnonate dehydratase [Acidimicrobiia bacterium]